MTEEPTKEQMVEQIRQKLTETMFWLKQAAEAAPDGDTSKDDIENVIKDLERLDMEVSKAFRSS